jgi:hypothetical protein
MSANVNRWLEDQTFLSKIDFEDKVYFQILAKEISGYLKNAPVPLATYWIAEEKRIYFMLGQHIKFYLPVDVNVSYKDSITKVEKYLKRCYPHYLIEVEDRVLLSPSEVVQVMKDENISLEEAFTRKKTILRKEYGVIDRIFKKEDRFILTVDDISTMRMSGIPAQNPMSISEFLAKLKLIIFNEGSGEQIKDFIFDNSVEQRVLTKRPQVIDYEDVMMMNFFDINFHLLKDFPLVGDGDTYTWGHYTIHFNSLQVQKECLRIYKERVEKLNQNVNS